MTMRSLQFCCFVYGHQVNKAEKISDYRGLYAFSGGSDKGLWPASNSCPCSGEYIEVPVGLHIQP